jgi:hypothetical protein
MASRLSPSVACTCLCACSSSAPTASPVSFAAFVWWGSSVWELIPRRTSRCRLPATSLMASIASRVPCKEHPSCRTPCCSKKDFNNNAVLVEDVSLLVEVPLPSQVGPLDPQPSQVSQGLQPAVGGQVGKARLPVRFVKVVVVVGCCHHHLLGRPLAQPNCLPQRWPGLLRNSPSATS